MKQNRKAFPAILCSLVVAFSLSVFSLSKIGHPKPIEWLSASWDYCYEDIEELTKASDLIALVKTTQTENVSVENSVPYTKFQVCVDTPVYHTAENDELSILMTGGETEDRIVQVEDDPLLQKGDECLVFCKQNDDGTYRILGGPQGRLPYHNGKVSPLNANTSSLTKTSLNAQASSNSNLITADTDANQLISEIKGFLAEQ